MLPKACANFVSAIVEVSDNGLRQYHAFSSDLTQPFNAGGLVGSGADNGKLETICRADIAVQHLTSMQADTKVKGSGSSIGAADVDLRGALDCISRRIQSTGTYLGHVFPAGDWEYGQRRISNES